MPEQLDCHVRLVRNPYDEMITNEDLVRILYIIARGRAEDIFKRWIDGEYEPDSVQTPPSFGVVIMDPTAPMQVPSIDAVLAIITIGLKGLDYVPNAAAKAYAPREKGADTGELLYAHTHRMGTGDFRWGHGAIVDGTSVGGSGLSERQDRVQAGHFAVDFNHMVAEAIELWEEEHAEERGWFTNNNEPGERFSAVLALRGIA